MGGPSDEDRHRGDVFLGPEERVQGRVLRWAGRTDLTEVVSKRRLGEAEALAHFSGAEEVARRHADECEAPGDQAVYRRGLPCPPLESPSPSRLHEQNQRIVCVPTAYRISRCARW